MTLKSPKKKGWILEKHVADKLRNTGIDSFARRNPGSGSGMHKSDIATNLPLSIECKNTKVSSILEWVRQAEGEAMGYQDFAVVWHPPFRHIDSSLVIIELDFFFKLIKKFYQKT